MLNYLLQLIFSNPIRQKSNSQTIDILMELCQLLFSVLQFVSAVFCIKVNVAMNHDYTYPATTYISISLENVGDCWLKCIDLLFNLVIYIFFHTDLGKPPTDSATPANAKPVSQFSCLVGVLIDFWTFWLDKSIPQRLGLWFYFPVTPFDSFYYCWTFVCVQITSGFTGIIHFCLFDNDSLQTPHLY